MDLQAALQQRLKTKPSTDVVVASTAVSKSSSEFANLDRPKGPAKRRPKTSGSSKSSSFILTGQGSSFFADKI